MMYFKKIIGLMLVLFYGLNGSDLHARRSKQDIAKWQNKKTIACPVKTKQLEATCSKAAVLSDVHVLNITNDRATASRINSCTVVDKEEKAYAAIIESVYDGDTFRIVIPGLPVFVRNMSIRIMGIDTPEMTGKTDKEKTLAKKAKEFTLNALKKAKEVIIDIIQPDKYGGRYDAHVYVDGALLADALIEAGLAVEYDGGTKPSWA